MLGPWACWAPGHAPPRPYPRAPPPSNSAPDHCACLCAVMQRCTTCGFKGATIGCMDIRCQRSFHLPCSGPSAAHRAIVPLRRLTYMDLGGLWARLKAARPARSPTAPCFGALSTTRQRIQVRWASHPCGGGASLGPLTRAALPARLHRCVRAHHHVRRLRHQGGHDGGVVHLQRVPDVLVRLRPVPALLPAMASQPGRQARRAGPRPPARIVQPHSRRWVRVGLGLGWGGAGWSGAGERARQPCARGPALTHLARWVRACADAHNDNGLGLADVAEARAKPRRRKAVVAVSTDGTDALDRVYCSYCGTTDAAAWRQGPAGAARGRGGAGLGVGGWGSGGVGWGRVERQLPF